MSVRAISIVFCAILMFVTDDPAPFGAAGLVILAMPGWDRR